MAEDSGYTRGSQTTNYRHRMPQNCALYLIKHPLYSKLDKRMMAKTNIYQKFTSDLDVVAIVFVGWICYKLIGIGTGLALLG
ncbi:hypothetical protein LXL04_035697 [Taraxacum kok-saghyz]